MNTDFFNASPLPPFGEEKEDFIAKKIAADFDKFEDARATQLDDIKNVKNEIYTKNKASSTSWASQINLPDIYEAAQTLKSHLIENLYSHPEAMFDVTGTTEQSDKNAPLQKAMLVNYFEKMKLSHELEKLIDSIVESGEATLFIGWETKQKEIRRKSL
ncbi:MAG: hypothetical protein PHN38_09670, partial [Sulfurospirillaceae bacterium]|nr:hypothetical protein [Sulfurospirillaceae bacterium]